MKVYFLRHGIAAEKSTWRGPDRDRPLTDDGRAGVERVATAIARLELDIQRLLTSPFIRASQTAEIVARRLGILERMSSDARLEPGFDAHQFTRVLDESRSVRSILFVGHEPDLSTTVAAVIGGGRLRFKKAGLIRVDVDETRPLHGELLWLIPPGAWG